jgi:glycosyltransferase involved in cell wall biosynthesis
MPLRLVSNWGPQGLRKELQKHGIMLEVLYTRSLKQFLQNLNSYDLGYFARFVPPLVEKDIMLVKKYPLVYAFHAPLTIDYPCRLSHQLYNVLIPVQAALRSKHSMALHVLNRDDLMMLRALGISALYLPLGIDVKLFRPLEKEDKFTVIYASRASWNKGTDMLVNVIIPQLLKRIRDIKIKIINYGFLTYMYKRISSFKNIEILPYLSPKEFAKVIAMTHVLLFPSRYESYGLVVLEALASGVIPVAFNVRGFVKDVLAKHPHLSRFVVYGIDIGGFLGRIMELYRLWVKDAERYYILTKEARELAEKYSWQNLARIWARTFKSLINQY